MIFHENCLLADDSHEISYLISFEKLGKKSQYLSSAAVVIGALRVKSRVIYVFVHYIPEAKAFTSPKQMLP